MAEAELAAAQSRMARQIEAVFDGDGNSVEDPEPVAAHDGGLGLAGVFSRPLGRQHDKGVQSRVQLFDLSQMRVHQLDRRDGAVAHHGRHGAQRRSIGH